MVLMFTDEVVEQEQEQMGDNGTLRNLSEQVIIYILLLCFLEQ